MRRFDSSFFVRIESGYLPENVNCWILKRCKITIVIIKNNCFEETVIDISQRHSHGILLLGSRVQLLFRTG